MRTLDAALTAAQQTASREPYLRVHFDNRDGTTYTYTTRDTPNRVVYLEQWEEPYAGVTLVRLSNYDGHFTAKDLRGYSVYIGWGLVLDSTPDSTWYSNAAPMKVRMQRDISYEGGLVTEFYCVSIWGEIEQTYILAAGKRLTGTVVNGGDFVLGEKVEEWNTAPAKTGAYGYLAIIGGDFLVLTRVVGSFTVGSGYDLIGATSSATGARLNDITADVENYGPLVYESGDTATSARIASLLSGIVTAVNVDEDDLDGSMADTPYLAVQAGVSVRAVIRKMLLRSKCGMRYENDDDMYILYLDTTDASQYDFDSSHAFFVDLRERAIILPNTVIFVDKLPSTEGDVATYFGSASDATSVGVIGTYTTVQVDPDLASNEEAATRAAAWIAQQVAEAYQGQVVSPMECGLEVYDMVQAVDSRLNVTSKGRIGRIERVYEPGKDTYEVRINLGSLYSVPGAMDVGPDSRDNDLRDLVSGLDKKPPRGPLDIIVSQLEDALLPITIDIDFSASDNDDIAWGAGTIHTAAGKNYNINSGSLNLANTNPYYLYYDTGVDDGDLDNTQTFTDTTSHERLLVAFAKKAPQANQKALIIPAKGGKSPTFNQDVISANCITASEIYVANLAAIAADMGLLTAGEIRVGTGTLGSNFTGFRLWVESNVGRVAGYASDVIQWYSDTDGKLYAGSGDVTLDSNGIRLDGPSFRAYRDSTLYGSIYATTGPSFLILGVNAPLELHSNRDVDIKPGSGSYRTRVTRLDTTPSDVTESRSNVTEYQNNTGKPLLVTIAVQATPAEPQGHAYLYADSSSHEPWLGTWIKSATGVEYGTINYGTVSWIVPVGWYYYLYNETTIAMWNEEEIG